jgi:hypothetical protein
MKDNKATYTADQIRDAEKVAAVLSGSPGKQHDILVMLGNAFIEGLTAGAQLQQMEAKPAKN